MEEHSTILIVDDKPNARKILGDLLARQTSQTYNLAFASSGEEALSQAAQIIPDLILLDVMMPGMDGFEVCRRLRVDPLLAEVPVIMITALHDERSLLEGLEAGADDFITKPFNHTELEARVHTITRLNRYRRLMAERTKFDWVVAQADEGYLVVDHQDHILQANPQARLYLDLPRDESLPLPGTFWELTGKHYDHHPQSAWRNWPKPAPQTPRYLIRPETVNTNVFWLQVDILDLPAGPDTSHVVRLRDVTEQMVLQYDVRGFHNLIRHKLRSPLAAVLSNMEILAQEAPSMDRGDIMEFVVTALRSAKRLHTEIEDVLRYLNISDMTQPESYLKISDFEAIVENIQSRLDLAPIAVRLAHELEDETITLSSQATEMILWEILENARKFHPDQAPVVDISVTCPEAGQISIKVSDDGLSLSPHQLANALTPYYQGEKYFTGEAVGMGLGLTIVASLTWRVGGNVHIYNREAESGVVVELIVPTGRQQQAIA